MALSADQTLLFEQQGYLAVPNVLTTDELNELRAAAHALEERALQVAHGNGRYQFSIFGGDASARKLQQVGDPHESGREWAAVAGHAGIVDVIADLLGPNIQLYYSMLMMKPPLEGQAAPWHQDFAFFPHDSADLIACQIYLDDSTVDNGCVRVVPASHTAGLLNHYRDGRFTGKLEGAHASLDAQAVALPMAAGGMNLWHPMLVHGSHPNRTQHARRALTLEYKDPACRLLCGSFSSKREVRPVGIMVRGTDTSGELLDPL
jgi:phytanoyl-CoA hydroxylase